MQTPTKARSSRLMATPIKGDLFSPKGIIQMGLNSPIKLASGSTPNSKDSGAVGKDKVIVCVK